MWLRPNFSFWNEVFSFLWIILHKKKCMTVVLRPKGFIQLILIVITIQGQGHRRVGVAMVPRYLIYWWSNIYLIGRFAIVKSLSLLLVWWIKLILSCDQAAPRTLLSVHLSIHPSVCLSHLFRNAPFVVSWNFQELLINVMPMQKVKVMSKVKVTEVKTIFAPIWTFPVCNSSLNSHMATKYLQWHRRGALLFHDIICQISRSHRLKNQFGFHLRLQGPSQLSNPTDFPCYSLSL